MYPPRPRLGRLSRSLHHGEKHRFAAETAEFFHSPGTAVAWSDARTLTEPRAAALAEMVKADMFTCECDSCVTCSGERTRFLSKQPSSETCFYYLLLRAEVEAGVIN